ncbi:SDR family oxidoreductase [Actinomadura roseirufa]|uniref:SDR family oxidoreductase n=1 Tax=Actinomadura roseirufa TaxID=2094049 RepID=UPI001040E656|nr:SDR family oxidoreductase [Actinomadura roseirufa]
MDLAIKGKVALVAGASSGLGLAAARALAAEGARVALAGRRTDVLDTEASALGDAIAVPMDLTDEESIVRGAARVRAALGPIGILVLNGGGPAPGTAADLDPGTARRDAELLLHGPMRLVRTCLPDMWEAGWGRVVAIGSSAVQQPIPALASSSVLRGALASYLKLLAEDVAPRGVTVNMVLPGRIATPRAVQLDQARAERENRDVADVRAASERTIPLGRYGTPEEFAAMVAFLCGEPASYVTGEQFRVDGGLVRVP